MFDLSDRSSKTLDVLNTNNVRGRIRLASMLVYKNENNSL
ncbi:hypothetical protein HAPS_0824 [Glaesserella parasuis SH0165]|uniref:Uncharacterized protein n=1 Tax=Glaesserella parasuis serovar 5 (strain SH0165) TaxID=557723 RepID=B8F556_GLAP5|nr:hypothetical protein HAPS_0824 [Glaesserella parasuis SH0165]EQA02777.1 hypothetical protein HPSNAG_0800 [Glaesserella parasuis str. Nagasaki]EQA08900.1 hypothetical protein HPS8415995_1101 [Glaesserella parasuis 84-15995]